jgi:hypothetical protein
MHKLHPAKLFYDPFHNPVSGVEINLFLRDLPDNLPDPVVVALTHVGKTTSYPQPILFQNCLDTSPDMTTAQITLLAQLNHLGRHSTPVPEYLVKYPFKPLNSIVPMYRSSPFSILFKLPVSLQRSFPVETAQHNIPLVPVQIRLAVRKDLLNANACCKATPYLKTAQSLSQRTGSIFYLGQLLPSAAPRALLSSI